ncbi:MAG TPA: hypothetical protein VN231_00860 [Allosphingosinicella sp.]|nr:hypothetical protein [Allosphingosinicella sp.]
MDDDNAARERRSRDRDEAERARLPAPWEAEEQADGEDGVRHRVDAFTPPRKKAFLKALSKSGCILDACREIGVSSRTVYNHQESDAEFSRHCQLAIEMSATPVELAAWERGISGVEVDVFRGGKFIGTTLKRSDSILRLLLQGANPKKYGPRPGFSRKRLMAHERKQIEQEIRQKQSASAPPIEAVTDEIIAKVRAITAHRDKRRLAEGWTKTEDGYLVPPGWVRADGGRAASGGGGEADGGAHENGDSM